ncbi:PIG-L deacetylase family protein [Thermus thermamylovorans]|uniref:PIG-L family deacetylase n=1 Tax=Thermus thermamylovorans TaxID=2509362 RepID=A0A4Q9B6U4_9DEIN|nr:PIG-L family deacetylase [Thermus thermamylovorans]TBH21437.1 PIG-L family deacetylase [Thermus thermamylovorans]
MRRLAPWQWLLLLLLLYAFLAEALRLWLGLLWAERVALLLAALAVWAFINGRFVFAYYHALATSLRVRRLPPAEEPAPGEHLLVLAPHPDDEVLAAAGRMRRTLLAGGRVSVVYLTSGDAFDLAAGGPLSSQEALRRLALRRMVEAWRGLEALGLSRESALFLGFPDQGLFQLFTAHYYLPYESPHTGLRGVAYPGCYRPGLPYTGKALETALVELLRDLRPTRILLPSPLDAHRDHQATAYFGMRAAAALGMERHLEYYLVHGGYQYPLPKGLHPRLPLYPPPRGRGLFWRRFPLTEEEVRFKEKAIRAHRSQMRLLSRFLLAFVRQNELFTPLPIPAHGVLAPEEEGWAALEGREVL